MKKKKKIFIGFTNVAGYYYNLIPELSKMGYEISYLDFSYDRFNYKKDRKNPISIFYQYLMKSSIEQNRATMRRLLSIICSALRLVFKFVIFVPVLFKYDVFIFPYLGTFFSGREMPLFRIMNKRVIHVCHGTDSRPPYLDGTVINKGVTISSVINRCISKQKLMNRISKVSTFVDNPAQAVFHRRKFIKWLNVGIPYLPINAKVSKKKSESFIALHAPSDPKAKGSQEINDIINDLKQLGYKIDLKILSGVPHSKVVEEIIKADFIIDQMWSDTPLAGLGTEAAFFGKPTIVSGYYNNSVNEDHLNGIIPPSFYCHPSKMKDTIISVLSNPESIVTKGKEAKKFVNDFWNAKTVASNFDAIINYDIPDEWWFDPKEQSNLYPCCISYEQSKKMISEIIENNAMEALGISFNPNLEKEVMEIIN